MAPLSFSSSNPTSQRLNKAKNPVCFKARLFGLLFLGLVCQVLLLQPIAASNHQNNPSVQEVPTTRESAPNPRRQIPGALEVYNQDELFLNLDEAFSRQEGESTKQSSLAVPLYHAKEQTIMDVRSESDFEINLPVGCQKALKLDAEKGLFLCKANLYKFDLSNLEDKKADSQESDLFPGSEIITSLKSQTSTCQAPIEVSEGVSKSLLLFCKEKPTVFSKSYDLVLYELDSETFSLKSTRTFLENFTSSPGISLQFVKDISETSSTSNLLFYAKLPVPPAFKDLPKSPREIREYLERNQANRFAYIYQRAFQKTGISEKVIKIDLAGPQADSENSEEKRELFVKNVRRLAGWRDQSANNLKLLIQATTEVVMNRLSPMDLWDCSVNIEENNSPHSQDDGQIQVQNVVLEPSSCLSLQSAFEDPQKKKDLGKLSYFDEKYDSNLRKYVIEIDSLRRAYDDPTKQNEPHPKMNFIQERYILHREEASETLKIDSFRTTVLIEGVSPSEEFAFFDKDTVMFFHKAFPEKIKFVAWIKHLHDSQQPTVSFLYPEVSGLIKNYQKDLLCGLSHHVLKCFKFGSHRPVYASGGGLSLREGSSAGLIEIEKSAHAQNTVKVEKLVVFEYFAPKRNRNDIEFNMKYIPRVPVELGSLDHSLAQHGGFKSFSVSLDSKEDEKAIKLFTHNKAQLMYSYKNEPIQSTFDKKVISFGSQGVLEVIPSQDSNGKETSKTRFYYNCQPSKRRLLSEESSIQNLSCESVKTSTDQPSLQETTWYPLWIDRSPLLVSFKNGKLSIGKDVKIENVRAFSTENIFQGLNLLTVEEQDLVLYRIAIQNGDFKTTKIASVLLEQLPGGKIDSACKVSVELDSSTSQAALISSCNNNLSTFKFFTVQTDSENSGEIEFSEEVKNKVNQIEPKYSSQHLGTFTPRGFLYASKSGPALIEKSQKGLTIILKIDKLKRIETIRKLKSGQILLGNEQYFIKLGIDSLMNDRFHRASYYNIIDSSIFVESENDLILTSITQEKNKKNSNFYALEETKLYALLPDSSSETVRFKIEIEPIDKLASKTTFRFICQSENLPSNSNNLVKDYFASLHNSNNQYKYKDLEISQTEADSASGHKETRIVDILEVPEASSSNSESSFFALLVAKSNSIKPGVPAFLSTIHQVTTNDKGEPSTLGKALFPAYPQNCFKLLTKSGIAACSWPQLFSPRSTDGVKIDGLSTRPLSASDSKEVDFQVVMETPSNLFVSALQKNPSGLSDLLIFEASTGSSLKGSTKTSSKLIHRIEDVKTYSLKRIQQGAIFATIGEGLSNPKFYRFEAQKDGKVAVEKLQTEIDFLVPVRNLFFKDLNTLLVASVGLVSSYQIKLSRNSLLLEGKRLKTEAMSLFEYSERSEIENDLDASQEAVQSHFKNDVELQLNSEGIWSPTPSNFAESPKLKEETMTKADKPKTSQQTNPTFKAEQTETSVDETRKRVTKKIGVDGTIGGEVIVGPGRYMDLMEIEEGLEEVDVVEEETIGKEYYLVVFAVFLVAAAMLAFLFNTEVHYGAKGIEIPNDLKAKLGIPFDMNQKGDPYALNTDFSRYIEEGDAAHAQKLKNKKKGKKNGTANGTSNGHSNGTANGHSTGIVNGHSNGICNENSNGISNGYSKEILKGLSNGHSHGSINGASIAYSNGKKPEKKSKANGHSNGKLKTKNKRLK